MHTYTSSVRIHRLLTKHAHKFPSYDLNSLYKQAHPYNIPTIENKNPVVSDDRIQGPWLKLHVSQYVSSELG